MSSILKRKIDTDKCRKEGIKNSTEKIITSKHKIDENKRPECQMCRDGRASRVNTAGLFPALSPLLDVKQL